MYYQEAGEKNTKKELVGEIVRLLEVNAEQEVKIGKLDESCSLKNAAIDKFKTERDGVSRLLNTSRVDFGELAGAYRQLDSNYKALLRTSMRADGQSFEDIERIIDAMPMPKLHQEINYADNSQTIGPGAACGCNACVRQRRF